MKHGVGTQELLGLAEIGVCLAFDGLYSIATFVGLYSIETFDGIYRKEIFDRLYYMETVD